MTVTLAFSPLTPRLPQIASSPRASLPPPLPPPPPGNVDPWHGLGVLEAPRESEPVMMIDGASHHFWTHIESEITQPEVQAAKEAIQKQVVDWLSEEDN